MNMKNGGVLFSVYIDKGGRVKCKGRQKGPLEYKLLNEKLFFFLNPNFANQPSPTNRPKSGEIKVQCYALNSLQNLWSIQEH